MQFEPDNEIGKQLHKNLIQKISEDFQKAQDDALDIADYIIYLIVAKKSNEEIVNEVQDTAEINITVDFINLIYNEIAKLETQYNDAQLQQEGNVSGQQPQQQQPQVTLSTGQIPTGPKKQLTEEEKFLMRQQRFGGAGAGISKAHGRGGISKTRTNGHQLHNQQQQQQHRYPQAHAFNNNTKQFSNINRLERTLAAGAGVGVGGIKNGTVKFVPQPPKGRCPDFPYCKNQACERSHPTKNCFLYPDCPNPPGTCNYLHPDQDQELIAKLEQSRKEFTEKKTNRIMVQQGSCKFGLKCAKTNCPFAHPTPSNPDAKIETLEWCPQGKDCQNKECTKSHPPPPTATVQTTEILSPTEIALEQCKFGNKCTNVNCPRRHATSAVPCRAGAECRRLDCTFNHPIKETCRFGARCTNKSCNYQHPDGKLVSTSSNTWTAPTTSATSAATTTTTVFQAEDQVMEQAAQ